jgi:glyoxylase-like metal-dependent hydrolase (beta-lactamase superfamily II)
VGHGTFFTGLVTTRNGPDPDFSWVYDCGSKRTKRISEVIEEIEGLQCWPEKIDLFVLSHFDDDHVNGVERLLRTRSVRCLALPYMDIGQRLQQASSVASDPCSASTALLQLDPVQWLTSQGLSDKVETVLMIRGGARDSPPKRAIFFGEDSLFI